jgi:hypothetical protein
MKHVIIDLVHYNTMAILVAAGSKAYVSETAW